MLHLTFSKGMQIIELEDTMRITESPTKVCIMDDKKYLRHKMERYIRKYEALGYIIEYDKILLHYGLGVTFLDRVVVMTKSGPVQDSNLQGSINPGISSRIRS